MCIIMRVLEHFLDKTLHHSLSNPPSFTYPLQYLASLTDDRAERRRQFRHRVPLCCGHLQSIRRAEGVNNEPSIFALFIIFFFISKTPWQTMLGHHHLKFQANNCQAWFTVTGETEGKSVSIKQRGDLTYSLPLLRFSVLLYLVAISILEKFSTPITSIIAHLLLFVCSCFFCVLVLENGKHSTF
jgi:hypothetical protein